MKQANYTYAIQDQSNDMYYIGSTGQPTIEKFNAYIRAKAKKWNITDYKRSILKTFDTRLEACQYEVDIQKANSVDANPNYYNTQIDAVLDYEKSKIQTKKTWENKMESGYISPNTGRKHTAEQNQEASRQRKGIKFSKETKEKMSNSHKGLNTWSKGSSRSEAVKEKMSIAAQKRFDDGETPWNKGIKWKMKTKTCPHCGLTGGVGGLTRYHFENCKHKGEI